MSEAIDAMLRITPPPWRSICGMHGARAEEDALNVDPVQALEVLGGRLLDRADVGDAGVVHEDVDPGWLDWTRSKTASTSAGSETSH